MSKIKEEMKITCPHCGEVFDLGDESSILLSRIKDTEFEKNVEKRVSDIIKEKTLVFETEKALTVKTVENNIKTDFEKEKDEYLQEISSLKDTINTLKTDIKISESEHSIAIKKAVADTENVLKEKIKDIEVERDYYKDLKAKMSTKMIGETLEQHCATEFERVRGMLPKTVYFEKDNKISETGSKGDFIYREEDENGTEIISIMFEMKNENETTANKHKNADFFKELDKDRKEKDCEYAVLVSLLEADSEIYNTGIVSVHQYDKMYVIRPQFFIQMITILRNAALSSFSIKKELMEVKNRNMDISMFEDNLNEFKNKFSYNYEQAHKRFDEAIEGIDKTINYLQKVRDSLTASDRQLRLANDKAEDITIKKLCKNNPVMEQAFKDIGADI